METPPEGEGIAEESARLRGILGRNVERFRGEELQETVARAIGVSQSTIARMEAGQRLPSVVVLKRLAAYFGTTMDALTEEPSQR